MDTMEVLIVLLCTQCKTRDGICASYPPSWDEAYRCKWNAADMLGRKLETEFKRMRE